MSESAETTEFPHLVDALTMAKIAGIDRDKLYDLANAGLWGAYRFGTSWRFNPIEVLEGNRAQAPASAPVTLHRVS